MKSIKSMDDYHRLLEESDKKLVFLYKHSSACSISFMAADEMNAFSQTHPEESIHQVLVIEDRPTSLKIAEESGITHQSPQLICFKNRKAVWKTSHHNIAVGKIEKALSELQST